MGSTRRTDAATFALGMWASDAIGELKNLVESAPKDAIAPLTALHDLIANARTTGDLSTLEQLRDYWEKAVASPAVTLK